MNRDIANNDINTFDLIGWIDTQQSMQKKTQNNLLMKTITQLGLNSKGNGSETVSNDHDEILYGGAC